jgi:hypothetical protein
VLLVLDEGLGIKANGLTQCPQEGRGAVESNGCLEVWPIECLTEETPILTIHADIGLRICKLWHIAQVRAKWEGHVDLGPDALNEASDLGEIAWHIKAAVGWANDVDLWLVARRNRFDRRNIF